MNLFLDTAHRESIKKYADTGLIDGITTNPTNLSKVGDDPTAVIKSIQELLPYGAISVEVTETEPHAVYAQARAIAALGSNIVVKIPCHGDYFHVIHQLVSENISVNITLVFTLLQGLFMCKLGVDYISPFVGRWDDLDVDGISLLHELRSMIDQYEFETNLLAASIRHMRHFHEAVAAGADSVTIPVVLMEKAIVHPLTAQGIALFDADWKKTGIRQFPA